MLAAQIHEHEGDRPWAKQGVLTVETATGSPTSLQHIQARQFLGSPRALLQGYLNLLRTYIFVLAKWQHENNSRGIGFVVMDKMVSSGWIFVRKVRISRMNVCMTQGGITCIYPLKWDESYICRVRPMWEDKCMY